MSSFSKIKIFIRISYKREALLYYLLSIPCLEHFRLKENESTKVLPRFLAAINVGAHRIGVRLLWAM